MKIVISGGGTGGHILPLIALIPELKKIFTEIVYMGSETGPEKAAAEQAGLTFISVPAVKFRRDKFWANFKIPFMLNKSIRTAKKILKELKPDVVFCKGGYVSLPIGIAAAKLKIPLAIHESDCSMGLTNKILARKAKLVMSAIPVKNRKTVVIGMPIREELFVKGTQRSSLKTTILITGGSSGAKSMNGKILAALPELLRHYNVIHLTGKGKKSDLSDSAFLKNYTQIEYADNIGELYSKSDIVISRAGATAIAELAALNKRMLLIPLPKRASRGDQLLNAEYYKSKGLCRVLPEENMNTERLIREIFILLNSPAPEFEYDKETNKKIVHLIRELIS